MMMHAHSEARSQVYATKLEWKRRRYDGGSSRATFRQCSFCGSIHPADLLAAMKEHHATLDMADWKYGWPHKFYVHGIPNGVSGRVRIGVSSGPVVNGIAGEYGPATFLEGLKGRFERPIRGDAPAHCHAKFYSEHMMDVTGDDFDALVCRIAQQTGVTFEMREGGKLYFVCPRRH